MDLATASSPQFSLPQQAANVAEQFGRAAFYQGRADEQRSLAAEHQAAVARQQDVQQRVMQAMAQGQGNAPITPDQAMQNLYQMGNFYIGAGDVATGGKITEQAAKIGTQIASAQKEQAQTDQAQANVAKAHLAMVQQLLHGVKDQASWERNNTLYTMMTGQQSPYANTPYDPGVVEDLKQQTITAQQQIENQYKAKNQASLDTARAAANRLNAIRSDILQRELEETKSFDKTQNKTSGKAAIVNNPSKEEMLDASNFVAQNHPDLSSADQLSLARAVAANAKAIYTNNRGLSPEIARQQALAEIEKSHDIQAISSFDGLRTKTVYRPGTSAATARDLPSSQNDLVNGHYYNTSRGPAIWMNGKFVPAENARTAAPAKVDNEPEDNEEPSDAGD